MSQLSIILNQIDSGTMLLPEFQRGYVWNRDQGGSGSAAFTESRPFPLPETGKIAIKVINDYGDEAMKVFTV